MSQWVQHISGQGEKWEVREAMASKEYQVESKDKVLTLYHYLPMSEYIPCDPPVEEWEDVTSLYKDEAIEIRLGDDERLTYKDGPHNGPCFIVERKKA